jgi:diguanylate cyclase (GGDEF)-like protein
MRRSQVKWLVGTLFAFIVSLFGTATTLFSEDLKNLIKINLQYLDNFHWLIIVFAVFQFIVILIILYLLADSYDLNKELQIKNQKLVSQLEEDITSGLSSYKLLVSKFEDEYISSARQARSFSVLMIDIVDFKRINDVFGHDVGDEVISWIGGFLKSYVRGRYDLAARFGEAADEFFFVIAGDTAALIGFTNRLRRDLEQECTEELEIFRTNDIALRFWSSGTDVKAADTWDTVLKRLNAGLIKAKETSPESIVIM